jgi:transposase
MTAIHGGQAKTDHIAAHTIAVRLRSGMLPQASVEPAARRATRDLRRRRLHLARTRGDLVAPVHQTNRQYNLPAIGQHIAYNTNSGGVAARCADAAGHKSLAVERALRTYDDALRRAVERTRRNTATHHAANTRALLHPVPGIGTLLSLVLLDEIPPIDRFPRGQDCASSGRLVTCAKASAGKRAGTAGTTIGQAPLTWAFAEAAVVCRRDHPAGPTGRRRSEKKHRQGKALTI